MDICEKIENARKKITDSEQSKRDGLAEEFKSVISGLRGKQESLREAHKIFRTLQANGFTRDGEELGFDREWHYKNGYFLSDGWFHWPGFDNSVKDVYFTCGGGACRFSCGIELNNGAVVVCSREFGTPTDAVSDDYVIEMIRAGGYFPAIMHGGGRYYDLKGSEVLYKLKYCLDQSDTFVQKIREYAEKVIKNAG